MGKENSFHHNQSLSRPGSESHHCTFPRECRPCWHRSALRRRRPRNLRNANLSPGWLHIHWLRCRRNLHGLHRRQGRRPPRLVDSWHRSTHTCCSPRVRRQPRLPPSLHHIAHRGRVERFRIDRGRWADTAHRHRRRPGSCRPCRMRQTRSLCRTGRRTGGPIALHSRELHSRIGSCRRRYRLARFKARYTVSGSSGSVKKSMPSASDTALPMAPGTEIIGCSAMPRAP